MSSKIKVDTIENVAGSGNVSLGSGHNLVVPGNITGQGTAAITGNTTVGGTLGVTGATTLANGGSAVPLSIATHVSTHELAFTGSTHANIAANNGANPFYIQSIGAGSMHFQTTSTDRMIIDASGRVTKPHQPAFMARNHGQVANNAAYVAAGVTMICHIIDHNIGGHYSTSNGRFTAPVAGRYHFGYSIGIARLNNGETLYPDFVKNGNFIHYQYFQNNSGGDFYGPISASCTFDLAANDYLNVTVAGTADWYAGQQETIMYGYLIG